jgi:hypothetical protein
MITTTRGLRVLLTAVVAVVGGLLLWVLVPGGAASAAAPTVWINLPAQGAGFTTTPSTPLLDMTRLAPGLTTTGDMGVRNGSTGTVDLALQFVNVTSDENGCTHAELAMPGGCSAGPGQLADKLVFSVDVADSQNGTYVPQWTGSAAGLEGGVQVATGITSGTEKWLRLSAGLPMSVGNEVQSDTFGFDLKVVLSGPGGGLGVDAASDSQGSAVVSGGGLSGGYGVGALSASRGSGLSSTGVPTALLLSAGLLLILSGALLVSGVRQSRRRPTTP